MPAVIIAEQARPRLSISHAMTMVGSLVRQLMRDDHQAVDGADELAARPTLPRGGRIHHVVFVMASHAAADTLTKAVRSIVFKSHVALPVNDDR